MKQLLILLTLIISHVTYGQSVGALKLNNRQSILKDRIYLTFPDSAKNVARSVDIMSHDPNAEKEIRIVFDNGEERLVFFAQELFMIGNTNLLESLRTNINNDYHFDYTQLKETKEISAIQAVPTKWDEIKGGILINSLTVMTKDNSLIKIDAFINPAAYKAQKNNYIELTKKVFSSLQSGNRFNNREARIEKHKIFGTEKYFVFDLPKDYIIQTDQKYDFQVFRIKKYINLEDSTWESVAIYTGHHPSYFYSEYGFDVHTEKQKTQFLDKKIDWLYFEDNDRKLYLKEQKIESNNIQKGLITHIALSSNNPDKITELTEVIRKIKLE